MSYLLQRQGWYVYNRRVPEFVKDYDAREKVRIALGTQCKRTALKKACVLNDEIEGYWQSLIQYKNKHSSQSYKNVVQLAKELGFRYLPSMKLAEGELIDILTRLQCAKQVKNKEPLVSALLGGEVKQGITFSEALERFWGYSKPTLMGKNEAQQKRWRGPRLKAVNNFIKAVGDRQLEEITNLDLVAFRDWWLKRIEKDGIKPDTVNKDFTHLKGIIETVSAHEGLEIDTSKLFKKIYIKEGRANTRASYTTNYIQSQLLSPTYLNKLDEEAQAIFKILANTGARPIEIVNLTKDDIKLNHAVPHIHIQPRKGYALKTTESERKIPLTNQTLSVFQKYTEGFDSYRSNSDRLSLVINTWLTKNNLRPTQKHSLYSLRHSFQDRLNALELPDRIQCMLMGHAFKRPKYGQGATLEHLKQVMKSISVCY